MKPRDVEETTDFSTVSGERLELECETKSFPTAAISWFKNGRPISPNTRIAISQSGSLSRLVVDDTNESDAGDYSCTGATSSATRDSGVMRVTINPSPYATKPAKILSERLGMELRIFCVANSHIKETLKWIKKSETSFSLGKNERFEEDTRIRVDSQGTLIIQHVQKQDEGEYLCTLGHEQATTSVKILGILYIKNTRSIHHFYSGDNNVIEVLTPRESDSMFLLCGIPSESIEWFHQNTKMTDSSTTTDNGSLITIQKSKLEIGNVQVSLFYYFPLEPPRLLFAPFLLILIFYKK